MIKLLTAIAVFLAVISCGGTRRTDSTPEDDRNVIDTISLPGGYRYIHRTGDSPMNEAAWWCYSNARPLVVYSRASETNAQLLTFHYREDGKIEHVREYMTDLDLYHSEPDSLLWRIYSGSEDCGVPYTGICEYSFIYDNARLLVEIISSESPDSQKYTRVRTIKAAPGSHLTGDFRPCVRFWISDLNGGMMNIYCREVPDDISRDTYTLRRWINFYPVTETFIEDGRIKRAKVYFSKYAGDYAVLEGPLDTDADIRTLSERGEWYEEFGCPSDFDCPPIMPDKYGNFPETIFFY